MKDRMICMRKTFAIALSILMTVMMLMPELSQNSYAAESDELSLELVEPKDVYTEGDPVFIKASGMVRGAWVGLYKKDEGTNPGAGGVHSLRWYYVANHDGEIIDITEDAWADARKDKVKAGDYKVVLYGDDGYENILDTVYFTVGRAENPDASDELSLELIDGKASYLEDEAIYIKATGPDNGSWVGLYPKGAKHASTTEGGVLSSRWFYVSDQNGTKVNIISRTFDDNKMGDVLAGEYEILLFGDGGYDNVVKTIEIIITENPNKDHPKPADELSLKLEDPQNSYKIGEPVYIRATGTDEGAWVGLYKEGDVYDPTNGGVASLRWYYVGNHNGEKVNIMDNQWQGDRYDSIEEGTYQIILFGDGGYGTVIDTITITVAGIIDIDPADFSLEANKKEYDYKESIKVKASGTGIAGGAWVGLYQADMQSYGSTYLYYYFVRDHEGQFVTMQSQTKGANADTYVGDGTYELVLFADSGYNLPILKYRITVTRATKSRKRLRDPGCTTFGLEYVVYEDGYEEYREVPTLGGHDWEKTPKHITGTATHQYICSRNEEHTKAEECGRSNEKVLAKASADKEGLIQYHCDVCNTTYTVKTPKLISAPKLNATSFVYNGKQQKAEVTEIIDVNENAVDSKWYSVTYPKSSKKVGKYTVQVNFKGAYSGSYKLSYKIIPKTVTIKKTTKSLKKAVRVKWSKAKAQASGYQIRYARNKKLKKAKKITVKGIKKTSAKIKKLKSKKNYYIQVRAYKNVSGKKYYSKWSNAKKIKVK